MKTTIVIPDVLIQRARAVCEQEETTLRALVEEGLVLALKSRESEAFKLRDRSVPGRLNTEFENAPWEVIRALVYEGHGG